MFRGTSTTRSPRSWIARSEIRSRSFTKRACAFASCSMNRCAIRPAKIAKLPDRVSRAEVSRDAGAQAHLRDCPACRSFVEDVGAIRLAALELVAAEPEPPAHIWNSLRAQLVQEGLIHSAP